MTPIVPWPIEATDPGGHTPWHSIDQVPPSPAFSPGDEVTVIDREDTWYDRDGLVHSTVPDERGMPVEDRYIVDFERGDWQQRRVYRRDQIRKR